MSPQSLFHVRGICLNWKAEEDTPPPPAFVEPEMGESEPTILELEVADIIISLLHKRRSVSGRQFRRRGPRSIPSDLSFPKWSVKRKRSIHTTIHDHTTLGGSHIGEYRSHSFSNTLLLSSPSSAYKENSGNQASILKSPKATFLDKEPAEPTSDHCCPNEMEVYFETDIFERGLLFWPGWRGNSSREYVLPDLNMSEEELGQLADAELLLRQKQQQLQQHVLFEMACRRLAAADARRKRRELQKLKSSINADAPLCSRVR